MLEAFPDLTFQLDATGRILDFTAGREADLDAPSESFAGRALDEVLPPDVAGRIRAGIFEVLSTGAPASLDYSLARAGGLADFEARLTPFGQAQVLAIVRDVTERHRLESQLRHAHKMEAVGMLAGGLAHDFSNILMAVQAHTQEIAEGLPPASPVRRHIDGIRDAAEHGRALIAQLLAYSRRQILQPTLLRPAEVLAGVETLLRGALGHTIELSCRADCPHLLRADRVQLEQVLLNLAINARDAMPEGGRLAIEVSSRELAEGDRLHERATVAPGPYVVLTVSDTGVGMDETTKARLFEPFFTTKALGQGTGLGLATVYGVVKQSGGYIFVESAPGEGATFRVYFPAAVRTPDAPAAAASGREPAGTVLVVEDDDVVRSLLVRTVRPQGWTALAAANGAEALALAATAERLDLLLTDLVLPGLDGLELARRVASLHPGIRSLVMSGHAEALPPLGPGSAYLEKPFSPEELLRAIAEVRAPS